MTTTSAPTVRLRADAWSEWMTRLKLGRPEDQAQHIGVSRSQLYRIIGGDVAPGERFIAACMATYDGQFEQLFEITGTA